ncbi:hypothetical protein ABID65_006718 [Bradyrhizobium sp. S3.9.2]|uniref:hypothetical protein n=1 Tax=Bradyrhizobium sp. S3.9.2 TaxID=3156432 RepID=UPI003392E699
MALLPKVKLKALLSFPAAVYGGAGIAVRKENGKYYFDLDFNDFPVISALPPVATNALIFDPATGQYAQIPIAILTGGAAPATANPLIESGTGAVGVSAKYAREDHVHPASGGGGGGIPEAPNDGLSYGRKSAAWAKVLDPVSNLADVQDAAASYRNLGGLDVSTVVNLTAASTLTSAAFGKLHFITGAAAFTTTLPTPVGNAGKLIGFVVGNAASATKTFTLTTPAGAIGRSGASIVMWTNESVLLRSNGADWQVLQAKQLPFTGLLSRSTDQASAAQPGARINLTTSVDPSGLNLCFDSVNQAFIAPRAGTFLINGYIYLTQGSGATYAQMWIASLSNGILSGVFSFTGFVTAGTIYGSTQQIVTLGQNLTLGAQANGPTPVIAASQVPARFEYAESVPSW